MAKKLEVRNLTISFRTNNGAVHAVRDVSFDLEEGETLAIAGESGSGKSVTNRAIMGILAGNAVVEGGEIIYDGKDLLKIPEEEFHTLRGHKLSMVFQDPLSALNPIMRIGKQLTEAMILNNKERRADGRKRFNHMLAELEKNMTAAGVTDAKAECEEFNRFTVVAVKLENTWKTAQENAISMLDGIEETENALLRKDKRKIRETCLKLVSTGKTVRNEWLIREDDSAFNALLDEVKRYGVQRVADQANTSVEDSLKVTLDKLRGRLKEVTEPETEQPNFFRIGYLVSHGGTADPKTESVESINARARKSLDEGFMISFLKDVEKALAHSAAEAKQAKAHAVDVLRQELPTFSAKELDKSKCTASAKKAADAVENAIDRLALDKDNRAYVFRSSMGYSIDRYFYGLRRNPKEQSRFNRDTVKFNKLTAKGKFAPSVVPLNLVDTDKSREDLNSIMNGMIQHFEQDETAATDLNEQAVRLVDWLKDRASEYAYHLTKGMARHRAIELMKEVGIPEPEKRYHQYPFEFSGGMRQRIVIAIALSANPDILICDEPTTALDVTIQAQILELINNLKKERNLSVIFITHDLGVVANMADKIAIMYAGKIVEYGTADDVFYDPRHPYTWALLSSMPDLETKEKLSAIPGTPPDMILPPKGDAFAQRNQFALQIDFEEQPPAFEISPTHWAATWLLHPNAPKVEPPAIVTERIQRMLAASKEREESKDATAAVQLEKQTLPLGDEQTEGGDQA